MWLLNVLNTVLLDCNLITFMQLVLNCRQPSILSALWSWYLVATGRWVICLSMDLRIAHLRSVNVDKRSRESASVSVLVLCYCIYIICSVCITLCIISVEPLAFTLLSLYCLGSTLNTSVYTVYMCVLFKLVYQTQ